MEEVRNLILRSQQGDLQARDQLVEQNLPLVKSIVGRFRNRGFEYEDLMQIGVEGLLKSIRDFNLEYDVRFSTYAVPKIMGEIRQQLRHASSIRVGRSLKRLASQAIAAKDALAQKMGRTPTIPEIASYLKVSVEEVVSALDAVAPVHSLQARLDAADDESPELGDFISTKIDHEEIRLKQALEKLEPLERTVILLRYFAEKTQTEVAKELGTSQAQISRLETRIVRQLRAEI